MLAQLISVCATCKRFMPLGATVCPRCGGQEEEDGIESNLSAQSLDELQRLRAMKERLLAWADQLEANQDKLGDVGKLIAAELRNRISGG